jgi:hypothetical protein
MEGQIEILKKTMDLNQYNPNRLTTPAAVKLELISEIQASLNAINGEESFGYNIQKVLKLYYAIERLKHIEPHWLFEVRVISAAGTLV